MMCPTLRRSKLGLLVSICYLALFLMVLGWVVFSASSNPADSGEAGILLLPFAMPWIEFMPEGWLGLPAAVGSVFVNAVLIYLVFGGLRPKRSSQ